jgi:hypothetical protein
LENNLKGLNLRSLRLDLHKIKSETSEKPASTIRDWKKKLGSWVKEIEEWYGPKFDFMLNYHQLPLRMLDGFSFDELCKLRHSSVLCMDESVDKLFKTSAQHEVIRKISSSMWRWGCNRGTWNEIVDAYNNIRRFTFHDSPEFEIRLDHTTGYNEYGYSKYSRIYIDGVFAYLVYYKGEHVLTIGFSITGDREVLIQQVQSMKRFGNRYLFRLPKNRMEFVIDLFNQNFPGYKIAVIDGQSLVEKNLRGYRHALKRVEELCEHYRRARDPESQKSLKLREEECARLKECISHLEGDADRLIAFYRDIGRHRVIAGFKEINHLLHRPIAA